jgi:GT2 family glycosyltransferase
MNLFPPRIAAPFVVTEFDLLSPCESIEIPTGAFGLGVLIRHDGDPVGYCIRGVPPGSRVTPEQIVTWAAEDYSPIVLPQATVPEGGAGFPSLSVAVCTRNHPDLLERCLRGFSVLEGADGIDILVVDNAPADDRTRAVVAQLPGVRYFREPVPGLDFARNRALAEARGELLAFIEDDAVVDRRWLAGLRRAWAANPDAGGLTGPILPYELRTPAQIFFEMRGGFGRSFQPVRFGHKMENDPVYPCHAGIFGTGCNMVVRCDLLRQLGGFDEALDSPPLPVSGDLDALFRLLISGAPLIYAPQMAVYHEHRRDYAALRKQMWHWGLGLMAFAEKHRNLGPPYRERFALLKRQWFNQKRREWLDAVFHPERKTGPPGLVAAEFLGGFAGLTGEYQRSVKRIRKRKQMFSEAR